MFNAANMRRLSDTSFNNSRVERLMKAIEEAALKGRRNIEYFGTLTLKEFSFFRNRGFNVEGVSIFGDSYTIIKW